MPSQEPRGPCGPFGSGCVVGAVVPAYGLRPKPGYNSRAAHVARLRPQAVSRAGRGASFSRQTSRLPRRARGFTLLEAIVALVIFSIGAFALYGWLDTNLRTLERVEAGRERLAASHSALDLLSRVNPMETPSGRREVGSLVVEWSAEPIEGPTDGMSQVGRPTLYEIGLYRMEVRVSVAGGMRQDFSIRQIGWRQVRFLELE